MRIAVVHWTQRVVGGAETYLERVVADLVASGHELGFWHEVDGPENRRAMQLPEAIQKVSISTVGPERALEQLRERKPDLIFTHIVSNEFESQLLDIAPTVFFAHAYYGTCISGSKAFRTPAATPCDRRFGWKCLLHYYPRRCGGLSPITMLRKYNGESERLELIKRHQAVVTNSEHLRSEYIRHGLSPRSVHSVPMPATSWQDVPGYGTALSADAGSNANGPGDAHRSSRTPWNLMFLGRMDRPKGGHVLLDALPAVTRAAGRPVRVIFAGDGPERASWQRLSDDVVRHNGQLSVEFVGWVDGEQRRSLLAHCDLLVVPSLWPEPFGLVGPEVGLQGIPVAAFAVGGIPEWLSDGVNGALAPGNPPTAAGLAQAVLRCISDAEQYAQLRRGAAEVARRFTMRRHLDGLIGVFEEVVENA